MFDAAISMPGRRLGEHEVTGQCLTEDVEFTVADRNSNEVGCFEWSEVDVDLIGADQEGLVDFDAGLVEFDLDAASDSGHRG